MGKQPDTGPEPNPQIGPRGGATAEISGRQLTLFHALEKRQPRLAQMYFGALSVLNDGTNPDSIALAAHGLRELMEKIPQTIDVPVKAQNERMGVKVAELRRLWETTLNKSSCHASGKWQGEIDPTLRNLLQGLNDFFDWHAAHHPRIREEIRSVLRQLDAPGNVLPSPIENENISAWREMRDFFVNTSHHRLRPERPEFLQRLDELEVFLLDRFHPRTFEDFEKIDALLREAEQGD